MTAVHQHPTGALPQGPSSSSHSSGHSHSPSLSTFGLPSASSSGFSSIATSSNATSVPTTSDWTELSPFQARYAPGSQPPPPPRRNNQNKHARSGSSTSTIVSSSSGQLPSSPSSNAPPRAIIGGVRRWMSLNRPGSGRGGSESTAAGNAQLRKKSKRYDDVSTSGIGGSSTKTGEGNNQGSSASQSSALALQSLVGRLMSPQVNSEEAAEYQWYSSQFAPDENESSLTEETETLTISTTYPLNLPPQSRPVGSGVGTGARGVSLSAAGAWATSTEGVSDSDLALYEAGVELASGDFNRVGELVASDEAFDQTLLAVYANAVSIKNAALNAGNVTGNNQSMKMKAYANWLSLGTVR